MPDLWLAKPSWYDPAAQQANFIVLRSTPGLLNWEPRALIARYFGRPAREYSFGPYTVLVWDRNLLSSVPQWHGDRPVGLRRGRRGPRRPTRSLRGR